MIVSELEELLALLPADMPVHIAAGGTCVHVTEVVKRPRHTPPEWQLLWPGTVLLPDGSHPPAVVIRGDGAPLWCTAWADEVPFRVTGRWPARPARRPR